MEIQEKRKEMPVIQKLVWDSEFFGLKVGRWDGELTTATESLFLDQARNEAFDCIYVFTELDDVQRMEVARHNRFMLADTRVTYRLHTASYRVDPRIRTEFLDPKCVDDVEAVRMISRELAEVSRFHADGRFRDRASEMYELWFQKLLNDPSSKITIQRQDGVVIGFIAYTIRDKKAELVLVAVKKGEQGRGQGSLLMDATNLHLLGSGVEEITAVTQFKNLSANRHYQRIGFRTHKVEHAYHAWTAYF